MFQQNLSLQLVKLNMKEFLWFRNHYQLQINILIIAIVLFINFEKTDLHSTIELNQKPNSFNKSLDSLANLAEQLHLSQNIQKDIQATATKQKLADISRKWANFAQQLTFWKANEVMEITRRAQEAQVLSLQFGSISTRLQSAVASAQNVFDSAFERYKILSKLAKAAETHGTETTTTLTLLHNVQSIRENWALKERQRAMRLAQYLQSILFDLRKATELSEIAHEYAIMTTQFKYFQIR